MEFMGIKYLSDSNSIRRFDPVELPPLTVLTGVNGSGKTHLLKAIASGSVQIGNIPIHDINYYSYTDFLYKEQPNLNSQQIDQARQNAWKTFCGVGNSKINWKSQLHSIWNSTIAKGGPSLSQELEIHFQKGRSVWDVYASIEGVSPRLKSAVDGYITTVKEQVFNNPNFRKIQHYVGVKKALQKRRGPLHDIDEEQFSRDFVPSSQVDSPIATSLGVIFTRYRVNQFLWAHRYWDRGGESTSREELFLQYEESHEKPWNLINEILHQIHEFSGEEAVFNFSISVPDDVNLSIESWQGYSYQPTLIDNVSGGAREFQQLSSGEQVLLALAISIYEARDDFVLPRLLLLDEVDASLHPSMTKALLETLDRVFVARGTRVILATHSPSTVALAPDRSVHVVRKGAVKRKIEGVENKKALELVTEGYATLTSGLAIFNEIAESEICVISEGRNTNILRRALNVFGQTDVGVVTGMEAVTGKDQLRTLFQIFSAAPMSKPILFVWDPDVSNSLVESGNVFKLILPRNEENRISQKGIENLFPESLFEGFVTRAEDSRGSVKTSFDPKRKADFEAHVLSNSTETDFEKFSVLVEKLDEIRATYNGH